MISFVSVVGIFQAHGHIGGKCPGDGNGFANEVGLVKVRALWDIERVRVIDSDAHDFAELGGCTRTGRLKVAFNPSTINKNLSDR